MTKILIVEDEEDVRLNLADLLEAEGYEAIQAKDGLDGYDSILLNEPDLILSDIRMPNMNGFELLEKLQHNSVTAVIPFIFLTARAEMQDLRKGMTAGADDYIIKPFKIEEVLTAVKSRLRKKDNYLSLVKEFNEVLIKRVPHELRTPLVGILGLSDIICENVDDISKDEIKKMAERIKHSGNRLHRRIEKFITYTELLYLRQNKKLDSINNEYEIETVTLTSKFLAKADEFERREDLNLNFTNSKVKIEPLYFKTMLDELIENSLKFSPKGSPISVIGKPNAGYYKVKISDEGIRNGNIKFEDIKALNFFDRHNLTEEGLGMGLAIVKKIIELNKGFVSLSKNQEIIEAIEIGIPLKS